MSKIFIEETSLTAIGDAIRAKNETTELMSPAQMATAISEISTGIEPTGELEITANGNYDVATYASASVNVPQDGSPPDEAFVISGSCYYRFANGGWDWFIEQYGNQITTEDITDASYMFNCIYLTNIPFDINFQEHCYNINTTHMFSTSSNLLQTPALTLPNTTTTYGSMEYMFSDCPSLTNIGKLSGFYPNNLNYLFNNCYMLRQLPEIENWNWDRIHTYAYASCSNIFNNCYSLRSVPEDLIKELYGIWSSYYNAPYNYMCNNCYTLDEVRGLRLSPDVSGVSTNFFRYTFNNCTRLKDVIFATQEDSSPYVVKFKSQVIDLSSFTGYAYNNTGTKDCILNYNSGITADKEVVDDATYQALKDDPDWFTCNVAYSRYNHDSAVRTINSLPDTSAYGTNTIQFRGAAGSATDGGAINTLTEEEIAVAAAKGWTVTLV